MIKPHSSSSFLFSLLIFISISSLHPPLLNDGTNTTLIDTSTAEPSISRRNYIVRFFDYKDAENHRDYLKRSIKSDGWEWIERRNAAAKFPTDFGVVSIEKPSETTVIVEIEGLSKVKDVSLDFSYTRGLLEEEKVERESRYCDVKEPGKRFTKMLFEEDEVVEGHSSSLSNQTINWQRHLLRKRSQVTSLLRANFLWDKGYTGAKVKVAIFDSGIRKHHPDFRNIKERTNWTNESKLDEKQGHGTFVAGVIASQETECLGFAPDAEIHSFQVFFMGSKKMMSYTSWFLDAFNYAIATKIDVLNLSLGSPDHMDLPFIEKVWEMTASNIIVVSAVGNDGPSYGTLSNPADQSDVIGVGAIEYDNSIAPFSSRGMTKWEIPHGYGRVKPDVVAYGREIAGSKMSTGCMTSSGTSFASPVVAGVVCLLVSVILESNRKHILNPASMKQALVEGASRLSGPNLYEQGAGKVDLLKSYEIIKIYRPRASIFPSVLDFVDCPYSWPFCRQPLYAGAMPVIFNATILNGMGVVGFVNESPTWQPFNEEGNLLSIHFTYSEVIWPWTGYLALHMQIKDEGAQFLGVIEGNVTIKVHSPPAEGENAVRISMCVLQLRLKVIPTPARSKRILWDQFHNINFPPGYIPRDSDIPRDPWDVRDDIHDWHGDHLHTNFHTMFNMLTDAGYYVEILGSPLTCFDAHQYGTLLLVDLEDEYYEEEKNKLREDILNTGLGLVVFAEWYNVETMVNLTDNTRRWWTPVTGGANVPAINELLAPFGIAFGDKILNGDFKINGEQSRYSSGTNIIRFPAGGYVHSFPLLDRSASQNVQASGPVKENFPILGFVEAGEGRISVYGDSNCLDSSHMVTDCFWLLKKILEFTSENIKDTVLFSDSVRQSASLYIDDKQLPSRRIDVNFSAYSAVIGKELICRTDSRLEVVGTKGYNIRSSNSSFDAVDQKIIYSKVPQKTSDLFSYKLDKTVVVASHWVVPAVIAALGFLLIFSFWLIRKKQPQQRKIYDLEKGRYIVRPTGNYRTNRDLVPLRSVRSH